MDPAAIVQKLPREVATHVRSYVPEVFHPHRVDPTMENIKRALELRHLAKVKRPTDVIMKNAIRKINHDPRMVVYIAKHGYDNKFDIIRILVSMRYLVWDNTRYSKSLSPSMLDALLPLVQHPFIPTSPDILEYWGSYVGDTVATTTTRQEAHALVDVIQRHMDVPIPASHFYGLYPGMKPDIAEIFVDANVITEEVAEELMTEWEMQRYPKYSQNKISAIQQLLDVYTEKDAIPTTKPRKPLL